jgi:chromosome segregation ATPase
LIKFLYDLLASQLNKLSSEGKKPVQVAIALNLREPEATRLYREYWRLKRLHKLNLIYEEIGDDIRHIIEIYRRAKKEGANMEHIVRLLQLADEDNAFGILKLERRSKWLIDKIHDLDLQIERAKNYLYSLNNEIAGAKYSLDYCHEAYERLRQELQELYEEKNKLEDLQRENNGNIAE